MHRRLSLLRSSKPVSKCRVKERRENENGSSGRTQKVENERSQVHECFVKSMGVKPIHLQPSWHSRKILVIGTKSWKWLLALPPQGILRFQLCDISSPIESQDKKRPNGQRKRVPLSSCPPFQQLYRID